MHVSNVYMNIYYQIIRQNDIDTYCIAYHILLTKYDLHMYVKFGYEIQN